MKKTDWADWFTMKSVKYWSVGSICCADEVFSTEGPRYDWRRLGLSPANDPLEADLLFVCGVINPIVAAEVKKIYETMQSPKWVIALGTCASTGGLFKSRGSECKIETLDEVIPVDLFVPGCPPRPESIMESFLKLKERV